MHTWVKRKAGTARSFFGVFYEATEQHALYRVMMFHCCIDTNRYHFARPSVGRRARRIKGPCCCHSSYCAPSRACVGGGAPPSPMVKNHYCQVDNLFRGCGDQWTPNWWMAGRGLRMYENRCRKSRKILGSRKKNHPKQIFTKSESECKFLKRIEKQSM